MSAGSMIERAEKILGADAVTEELADFLDGVERYARRLGSPCESRQILALALATYRLVEGRKP